MPLDEIAGSALGTIARFLGHLFIEIVLEIMIKGPGYLIAKYVVFGGRRNVDPDGRLAVIVGVLFWISLILGAIYMFG